MLLCFSHSRRLVDLSFTNLSTATWHKWLSIRKYTNRLSDLKYIHYNLSICFEVFKIVALGGVKALLLPSLRKVIKQSSYFPLVKE